MDPHPIPAPAQAGAASRDVPDGPRPAACANCGAAGESRFCGDCGQERAPRRLTLRVWLREAMEDLFSIDGRFPRTLWGLLVRPGQLTRAWLEGRRASYTPPLRMYVVASALFFGVSWLVPLESTPSFVEGFRHGWIDAHHADRAPGERVPDRAGDAGEFAETDLHRTTFAQLHGDRMRAVAPRVLIAFMPVFALLIMLLFRRSGLLYLEHLVFAVHVHAFAFLSLSALWLADRVLSGPFMTALFLGVPVWVGAYVVVALRRMYGRSWAGSAVKGGIAVAAHGLLVFVAVLTAAAGTVKTPLDQLTEADRLYLQVLEAEAAGETGDAGGIPQSLLRNAIVAYERLEAHAFQPHARYYLADLLMRAGHTDRAHRLAREVLLHQPDHVLALGLAAVSAEAVGDTAAAAAFYARFLEAAEEHPRGTETEVPERHLGELDRYRTHAARWAGRPD